MKDDEIYQIVPRAVSPGPASLLDVKQYLRNKKHLEAAASIPFAPRVRTPQPQNPVASSSLRRRRP